MSAKNRLKALLLSLLASVLHGQGNQNNCPYLRYILVDACGDGNQEGFNELLIFYTPISININDLRVSFPFPPNENTNRDTDNPTTWVCYGCGFQWVCSNSDITNMNNQCGSPPPNIFTCPPAGTPIPANSFILVFTGADPTNIPNVTAFCGLSTVYVLFANNTGGNQGRYTNNPTNAQNRRTRVEITGRPECAMTVNYRNISGSRNNAYLLIDPDACIGSTAGQNDQVPPNTACYYAGANDRRGVEWINGPNPAPQTCQTPPISVLPIIWQEVEVAGGRLRWRAVFVGERGTSLTLWHRPPGEGMPYIYRAGLSPQGELELFRTGAYYLTAQTAEGGLEQSPVVWYEGSRAPFIQWAEGLPLIELAEEIAELQVWDLGGRLLLSQQAPVRREVLTGLREAGAGVYLLNLRLHSGEVRQERILLMP